METCQLKYSNSLLSFYKSGIRLETCDSQGPIRKLWYSQAQVQRKPGKLFGFALLTFPDLDRSRFFDAFDAFGV